MRLHCNSPLRAVSDSETRPAEGSCPLMPTCTVVFQNTAMLKWYGPVDANSWLVRSIKRLCGWPKRGHGGRWHLPPTCLASSCTPYVRLKAGPSRRHGLICLVVPRRKGDAEQSMLQDGRATEDEGSRGWKVWRCGDGGMWTERAE